MPHVSIRPRKSAPAAMLKLRVKLHLALGCIAMNKVRASSPSPLHSTLTSISDGRQVYSAPTARPNQRATSCGSFATVKATVLCWLDHSLTVLVSTPISSTPPGCKPALLGCVLVLSSCWTWTLQTGNQPPLFPPPLPMPPPLLPLDSPRPGLTQLNAGDGSARLEGQAHIGTGLANHPNAVQGIYQAVCCFKL